MVPLTWEQRARIRHDLALAHLAGNDAGAAEEAIRELETALTEIPENLFNAFQNLRDTKPIGRL